MTKKLPTIISLLFSKQNQNTTRMLPTKSFGTAAKWLCFVLFFMVSFANAANRYTVANGNWNSTSTWSATSGGTSGASFPVAGDVVFIEAGRTVTITADAACTNLNIASGSTLIVGGFSITVSGTTIVSGTLTHNSTAGTKTYTGLVTVNGIWNNSGNSAINFRGGLTNNGTFTAGTGLQTFNTSAQAVSGNITIPNVVVTGVTLTNNGVLSVSTLLSGSGTLTNESGSTLSIGGSGTNIMTITTLANAGTMNVGGSGIVNTALANFTNTGTLNLGGTGAITGITNNASGTVNLASSGAIGTFNNANATSVLQITAASPNITTLTASTAGNTVNYNAAGAQTIKSNAYSNLTLSNSGTKTLGGAVTTGGALTLNNNTSLDMSTYLLTLNGNLINGGSGTITGTTGGVTISGGNAQSIGGFTTTGNVSMLKTGNTTTFTGAVNGAGLTINGSGATLNLGISLTHTFTGNWIRTAGTLNGGSSVLKIGGDISGNGGTFTAGTGTVEFNRAGAQNLGTGAITYNNLILSGSGTKTFGAIATVSGNWSMVSGPLANLGGFTHTAGTLVLGGAGPLLNSWGSTASGAVNTTNDYFTGTGIINVSGAPYPAIDNNYASYSGSGVSGQVAGTSGEYADPPTNSLPGSLTLAAPAGSAFINVKFASYGSPGGTSPNFTIGTCHAFNSRTVTTGLLGNNIATIPASGSFNNTFGDPCYGVVKSYNVVATYAEPFCTTSPISSFVIDGSTPTGGNNTYAFLWEVSTAPNSGYIPASGTNNAEDYTVPAGISQTTYYRRTVTSGIYSDATIVIVQVTTGPPVQPTAFTSAINCDGTATLSVSGGSLGLGGYVEFYSGSCGGTVVGTSNVIPANLVVSPSMGNTTYYVRYKNSCDKTAACRNTTVSNTTVSISAAASTTSVCFSTTSQNASLAYTATTGTPDRYSITWNAAAITAGLVNQTDVTFPFVTGAGTLNTIAIPANVAAGTYTGTLTVKRNTTGCVSFMNVFTVTVNTTPTLTTISAPAALCSAGSINPSVPTVTANGSPVTASGWQLETTVGGNVFSNITIPYTVSFADNGKRIRYYATNSCGTTYSNLVSVTVNAAPTLTTISAPAALCSGGSINPSVPTITANGSTVTASGWQLETTAAGNVFSNITFPYTVSFADSGKRIRYFATNSCGTTYSNLVSLTVNTTPTLTTISAPAALCSGGSINPSVPTITANGSTVTASGWQLETTAAGNVFSNITFPYTVSFADSGKRIRYYATNSCGTTYSNLVSLTVNATPTLTAISAIAPLCSGGSINPSVPTITANGSTVTASGWQLETTAGGNVFSNIIVPYTVAFADLNKKIRYFATNGCGSIYSNEVALTVNAAPTITSISTPASFCSGDSLNPSVTTVTANGSTVTASGWQLENTVGGNVFSNLTVPYTVVFADHNKKIRYFATNSCGTTYSNEVTLTVNNVPTISVISTPAALCSGESLNPSAPTVTPNGAAVTTSGWQLETAVGSLAYSNITVPYTVSFADNGKKIRYYAVNSCGTANGNLVSIVVNPIPTAPTVGTVINISCTINAGSIQLTGLPSGNWTINQTGNAIASYGGNTPNFTVTGLSAGSYTFTVNSNGCSSIATAPQTIVDVSSTTWNGTGWSNGIPNTTKNAIIASVTPNSPFTSNITACALTINTGVVATVSTGITLTIINAVTTNGQLIFENNSSLVQDPATIVNINSGSIIYKRVATAMKNFDFSYWSSPVVGQNLLNLSPNTLSDKYFSYTGSGWKQEIASSTTMAQGIGYIIRVPKPNSVYPNTKDFWTGSNYAQPVEFVGKPNNGTISGQAVTAGNFYLIGNPYPSAVDADEFLYNTSLNGYNNSNNVILNGTIYFWTHNTAIQQSGSQYIYKSDDYASYNGTGGTATQPAASGGSAPSGYIAAGQSFFGSAKAAGTIQFKNNMRVANNNGQFFKPAKTSKSAKLEKSRLWLNMTNSEGAFKQTLIGYVTGATNDFDGDFDGISFDGNSFIDFYSVNKTTKFVIQGRSLPFEESDSVPLGFRSSISGNFTISIGTADGLLESQKVYLEDKQTNIIHDLTENNYVFSTAKGTFNERFVLKYTNKTLGTGDFETQADDVEVLVKNKIILISSGKENIAKVFVYDILGKQLYQKEKISNVALEIENLKSAQQVLLVKVILSNGYQTTKKVIFK
ncbi:T9SS sorting signal type C domain-containing protein [Flavobacterium sp.]|uniref:T9SS sorting signal type C domain-containing protein n=1 Tax=Flavobacterium sp. TaxID=239 RepID=UPI003264C03C